MNYQTTATTSSSDIISSERVEGTAVYNTAGDKLGSIDDLMIDKRSADSLAWAPTATLCR